MNHSPTDDGWTDILLVGSDARTDAQGNPLPARLLKALRTEDKAGVNTDTINVLRIRKKGGKPSGISIPRDAWVDVPGRGKAKINSAYGVAKTNFAAQKRREGNTEEATIERDSDQAGRKALVQTVQDFTQLRIDHYAEVNLLGFYPLTEALGGVQVCLNHPTSDSDSGANFRASAQTVSAAKRFPLCGSERTCRAAHRSIVADPGLDLLDFANQVKGIASSDMSFVTIPVVNINGRSEDGQQSIVEVDPVAVRQFMAGLVGRSEPPAPASANAGAGGGGSSGGTPVRESGSAEVACVN